MKWFRPRRPVVFYDANCGFCSRWIARWRARTGDRVDYVALQRTLKRLLLGVPRKGAERALQLVEPSGERSEGAHAVFRALRHAPELSITARVLDLPGVRHIAGWVYRRIARHRRTAAFFDRLLFGRVTEPAGTRLVRWVFLRALGGVYFVAFTSLGRQVRGLYGTRGILPVDQHLDMLRGVTEPGWRRLRDVPTVFWKDASDESLVRACRAGQALSLALVANVAPRASAAGLWGLYLSFMSVGRVFLGYQWDALLLESGLHAILVAPRGLRPGVGAEETPWPAVALMRLLVFKLYYESGLAKRESGDPTWRDHTALAYHHETQPLPTRAGWHAHHMPLAAHKFSTWASLALELVLPYLTFGPRRPRQLAFAGLTALQGGIAVSGNYGFFNILSAILNVWLLDDAALAKVLPKSLSARRAPRRAAPLWRRIGSLIACAPVALASVAGHRARYHQKPLPRWLDRLVRALRPLHSVNNYGLFSVMTTVRPEVVVEGSDDGVTWREYRFRYKVGDLYRAPRWVTPHMPRLDWQMWFAALDRPPAWFVSFLARLLEGAPDVLALLNDSDGNPFAERPPRAVRALLYDYRMTDEATRRATGQWWRREPLGLYVPPITLRRAEAEPPPPPNPPRADDRTPRA